MKALQIWSCSRQSQSCMDVTDKQGISAPFPNDFSLRPTSITTRTWFPRWQSMVLAISPWYRQFSGGYMHEGTKATLPLPHTEAKLLNCVVGQYLDTNQYTTAGTRNIEVASDFALFRSMQCPSYRMRVPSFISLGSRLINER